MGKKRKKHDAVRVLRIIFAIIIICLILAVVCNTVMSICAERNDSGEAAHTAQTQTASEATQSQEQTQEQTQTNNDAAPPPSGNKASAPASAPDSGVANAAPRPDDNQPLVLGNPSGAAADEAKAENYLLVKAGYVMSYNASALTANWVAWHLDSRDLGDAVRSNTFRTDDALPAAFFRVKSSDYQFNTYGFDRGHLCPSADRTGDDTANSETFLMTNMVPQSPDNNRVAWKSLESYERETCMAGNELYIFAGVQGLGGQSAKGEFNEITLKDGNTIAVPAYTWKIMLILPDGDGDIERINKSTRVIAVMVPNRQGLGNWEKYTTTVDSIEDATLWDFFAPLDDDIEDALEAGTGE